MKYLLDTNICIYFLNKRSESLVQRFYLIPPADIALCSIVRAELWYGALKSGNPGKNLALLQEFLNSFASLPFDDKAAEVYGQIRTRLEHAGTPIGPYDLCIAATAITNNLTLITHNAREFMRVDGLQWEDWK